MRFTSFLILASAAVLLNGCAPAISIHPFYTSADLTTDLPLAGTWTEPDGEIWRIDPSGNGFNLTVLHAGDSPSTEEFNAHLLRLDSAYFLDVTSKSNPGLGIAGHLLAKVSLDGDDLGVTLLNDDWLKKNASAIAGANGQLILTASTVELQHLVLSHLDVPAAWDGDTSHLLRLR